MDEISPLPLDSKDRMDLVILSGQPQLQALWKLMQQEVLRARDEAMLVDPSERDKQAAAMTVAHAMAKFFTRVRKSVEYQIAEHIGEVQALADENIQNDTEALERYTLQQ